MTAAAKRQGPPLPSPLPPEGHASWIDFAIAEAGARVALSRGEIENAVRREVEALRYWAHYPSELEASGLAGRPIGDVLDALAAVRVLYEDKLRKLVEGLDEGELASVLNALALADEARHVPEPEPLRPHVTSAIAVWTRELFFRRAARRMAELGCVAYCPAHDCDANACPPEEHL